MESIPDGTRIQQRKITRNRELRACVECRRRKLRCDRRLPCGSCTRRSEASSCVYEKDCKDSQSDHERRLQAEARLEHLERLVQELSQSRQNCVNHDVNPGTSTATHGRDELPNDSLHNGATHWSAMLENIEQLRAVMKEGDGIDNAGRDHGGDEDDGTSLLFGATRSLSFQQVLSDFLPSRHETDRAVAAYFRAKAVAAPFLHTAHFTRLYRDFWDNPSSGSPLWTSILFSMVDIATRTLSTTSTANSLENSKGNRFAIAAAHCLADGQYYRPQRFAVEALLLYGQARCLTSVDISPEVGILFGTLCRLAATMGYHRDADRSREVVSAFEGEMRRRAWSLCMQLDMLVSFQLGLPSNIQFPTWDTRPPTNLLDSDFDETTVQLPPARPNSESTELLFYIAKHRLMAVFEKIIRHTLSATDRPSEELEMIDQELRDTYAALPVVFQPRPMTESVFDSPSLIVTRLCVSRIYQKCLYVLHRKQVTLGRQKSLQICDDSASDLIKQYLDMNNEFEKAASLNQSAGICLVVCSTRHYASKTASTAIVDVAASLELLRQAKAVCETQPARSKDTRKVRLLLGATIAEFSGQRNEDVPTVPTSLQTGVDVASGTMPSSHDPNNSLWNGNLTTPVDDVWAYMQQFLNLPSDDIMTDSWC